ncbi:molybdate metabolism regulator domain protein, partial [Klebsiella aerogenes]
GTQTPQKKPFSVLDRITLSEAVNDIQALFD